MRRILPFSALCLRTIRPFSLGVLLLAGAACEQRAENIEAAPEPEPAPSAAPSLPAVLPGLSRADLILAVEQSASDHAAGTMREGSDPLVGRTFSVTVAFGCGGPREAAAEPVPQDAPPGLARAVWGAGRETIELQLTPASWSDSVVIAREGEDSAWEAVEGFWLPRPWMRSADCPAVRGEGPDTTAPAGSPQTLGLAAIFEEGGSRIGRRNGRPYAFTIRAERNAQLAPPAQGYRLVLEGRTVAFPDGRAVRCRSVSADVRPVCVIASRLDRVAFETADGQLLSEWRSG